MKKVPSTSFWDQNEASKSVNHHQSMCSVTQYCNSKKETYGWPCWGWWSAQSCLLPWSRGWQGHPRPHLQHLFLTILIFIFLPYAISFAFTLTPHKILKFIDEFTGFRVEKTQESVHYVKIHFENRVHWVCFIINYTRTTYAQNISLGGLLTLFLI